jgi:sugar phosphate isomerase/epimerase
MNNRILGIDFISVLGLPPVEFAVLAKDLGCQQISIGLSPITQNPHRYPAWSMREDAALRRDFRTALADNGITLALGEAFLIMAGKEIRDAEADLDVMQEIGAPQVNILALDSNWPWVIAELAWFTEMAAKRGMKTTLELLPGVGIGTLERAVAALAEIGNPALRLLLDSMHLYRSGASTAAIAALDPAMIGHVQLCDVPRISAMNYGAEATHHRLPPGKGDLPLGEFVAALPREIPIGLEVPMLAAAEAGIGPYERLAPCVAAARALFAR